jgi:hypothetical protein
MPNSSRLSPWKAEVIETRGCDRSTISSGIGGALGTDGGTLESAGPPRLGAGSAPRGGPVRWASASRTTGCGEGASPLRRRGPTHEGRTEMVRTHLSA